ncbi:OmpA family protein [Vibrio xiamenensis]|uniref:OmpA family protein n=1 Tax=Vibrio xiamenensis TaxID=861298 RepID=A0A1G8DRS2_9VIBR|nr:OmpA family protein [Vibrio xiamenensis]SDH60305.1 OmpA family protein [Vibrio xiamenensis]
MPASHNQRQLYLMGRLYGRKGQPASRYFPLPFETLTAPGLKFEDKLSIDPQNKKSVVEVTATNPIAVSDKHGVLNVLSEDIKTGQLVRNPVTQSSVKTVNGKNALPQVLFFPSYLVPMTQLALQTDSNQSGEQTSPTTGWLEQLYGYLQDSAVAQAKECCVDMNAVDIDVESQCLPPQTDKVLSTTEYFKNYNHWLKNHNTRHILAIEVPQFYTIQIVFSSKDYERATVTLSDLSEQIVTHNTDSMADIVGDQPSNDKGQPVSLVQKTEYFYYDSESQRHDATSYIATFWIQSPKVLTLPEIEQFSRIDVSFELLEDDEQNKIKDKGIPLKYSLKENLFKLPIQTLAGRCTLINGDPISVEEALLNHAPQFYTNVMETMVKQPFDLPEKLATNNTVGASLPQQTWSVIQNNKGILETSFGALEKGVSWITLAKVASAATSGATGFTETVNKAIGVGLASVGFMKTLGELNTHYDNKLSSMAKTAVGALSSAVVFGERASPHIRATISLADLYGNPALVSRYTTQSFEPLLRGVGKFGSFILDKVDPVLTVADMVNGWGMYNQKKLEKKNKDNLFRGDINRYMYTTSSLQESKLTAFQQDQTTAQKYQDAIGELRGELAENFVSGKGHVAIEESTAFGTLLRLDATLFEFNKADIIADKGPYQKIAEKLEQIKYAPFKITITGHTCIIGSEDVNLRLSKKRAEAVKNAILAGFSDQNAKELWAPYFELVAKGYSEPLPGNTNRTKEEREKNRRVEIFFNFSTSVDYPPSRAGLYEVEKSAKQKILADIGANTELVSAINSTIDFALQGISAVFPPARFVAAGKQALELAQKAVEFIEETFQSEKYKLLHDINAIRYQDLMAINTFLAHSDTNGIDNVHLRAYMKRMTALNGLMRLLKTYQLAQLDKAGESKQYSDFQRMTNDVALGTKANSFDDFKILDYIDTYILNDNWDLDVSLQGTEHLDEVWLETNGYVNSTANIIDGDYIRMSFSSASAVVRKLTADDQNQSFQQQALNSSKYFPIHYRASEDGKHFKNLLTDTVPKNLDKSIFKQIAVFVRRSYKNDSLKAPKQSDWIPFEQYYQENQSEITPYDNIKVIAILDEKEAKGQGKYKDISQFFPVNLIVHSQSSNEGAWHFFDSVASSHTEYVRNINRMELSEEEAKVIFSGDNAGKTSLMGVCIQPSYFFGARRIFGIRPIADYDSAVMKGLFDSKSKSITSGARQFLSYSLSILVPGQSKTETDIKLVALSQPDTYSKWFNMTLSPTRSYEFTKDFKNFSPPQLADGLFYEKSFLQPPVKDKELSYPEVFDSAQTLFYLQQSGSRTNKQIDTNIAKDPLVSNEGRLRGKIYNFDWDKDVTATLIIKTKPSDPQSLIDQQYDPNIIPIDVKLVDQDRWIGTNNRPVSTMKNVIRIGTIVKENDGYKFEPNNLDKSMLSEKLSKLISEISAFDVKKLKVLSLRREDKTELFANVYELSYINYFGHEVKGLVPLLKPSDAYNFLPQVGVKFTAYVNGPHKSGLNGAESNEIHIYDAEVKRPPQRWYQLKDKEYEVNLAKEMNASKTDNELYENLQGEPLKFIPHQNLRDWMQINDHVDSLVQKRLDMLGDWVN